VSTLSTTSRDGSNSGFEADADRYQRSIARGERVLIGGENRYYSAHLIPAILLTA
jgi:hypothetical protein